MLFIQVNSFMQVNSFCYIDEWWQGGAFFWRINVVITDK